MKHFRKILTAAAVCAFMLVCAALTGCGSGVTLSFDGGEAPFTFPSVEAEKGAEVVLPEPAVWEGHAFDGWFTDPSLEGEGLRGTISAPERNTKYYAKWETGYALNLNADGGTLASPATLYLKSGADVYEAVKDLVPERSGLTFAGWYSGSQEVLAGLKMPAGSITLTARYKVGYTVEFYMQGLEGGYEKDDALTVRREGLVGETVSAEERRNGFTLTEQPQSRPRILLTERAAENVIRLYFDRNRYSVRFEADLSGAGGGMETLTVPYGTQFSLPECTFSLRGYRFAGWSETRGGAALQSGFTVERDVVLHALWVRGNYDRFGGNDLIFLMEDGVAILERGEMAFEGTYTEGEAGADFLFEREGSEPLRGRAFGGSFTYLLEEVAGTYVSLALNYSADPSKTEEELIDERVTLTVDPYLGAVYKDETGEYEGELDYDPEMTDYVFTVTSGALAGESLHLKFGVTGDGAGRKVFTLCGGELAAQGYTEIIVSGDGSYTTGYLAYLDGYGVMALAAPSGDVCYGSYYLTGEFSNETQETLIFRAVGYLEDDYGFVFPAGSATLEFYVVRALTPSGENDFFVEKLYGVEGAYRSEDGTLELDGFGVFPGSAVLTLGNGKLTGGYDYVDSEVFGSFVTFTAYEENGAPLESPRVMRFLLTGNTFSALSNVQGNFREMWLMYYDDEKDSPAFAEPNILMLLYEGEDGGGTKTELYERGTDGFTLVASGKTVSRVQPGGRVTFYDFACEEGRGRFDGLEEMRFLVNYTTPDNGLHYYNVFYLLSYNGEAEYTELAQSDGEGRILLNNVNYGMGSVYIDSDGNVWEGHLEIERTQFFGFFAGNFYWLDYDAGTDRLMTFEIEEENGEYVSFKANGRRETPVYGTDEAGEIRVDLVDFVLDGEGGGVFLELDDYGAVDRMVFGTCRLTGKTRFDEDVYTFFSEGEVDLFTFVFGKQSYFDGSTLYELDCYYRYNEAFDGVFEGEDMTLEADGYHTALYAPKTGAQRLGEYGLYLEDGASIVLFREGGEELPFEISGDSAVPLDDAYGSFDLYYRSVSYTLFFNGRGTVEIHNSRGETVETGIYRALPSEEGEYFMSVDLEGDGRVESLRVSLTVYTIFDMTFRECVVYDEAAAGVLADADWNVLVLDGYGGAEFYGADGSAGKMGTLDVVDGERHFAIANFSDMTYLQFTYSVENGTFDLLDYSEFEGMLYFSQELFAVEFGTDGAATVYGYSGPYFAEGNTVYMYAMGGNDFSYTLRHTMPRPSGGARYEFDGKTFYRHSEAEEITLRGTISFEREDGSELAPDLSASLSFTLPLSPWFNQEAILSADGDYPIYLTVLYEEGRTGAYLYDENYNYYKISLIYVPGGEQSFRAAGGETENVLFDGYQYDAYENGAWELDRVSTLTTVYAGYGPIMLEVSDPEIRGELYYEGLASGSGSCRFTAKAAAERTVGYDSAYGDVRLLPFEKDGKGYALAYSAFSGRYELYMAMEYSETVSGGYTVGLGRFVYANRYDFALEENEPAFVTLSEGERTVKWFNYSFNSAEEAWLVDMGSYELDAAGGESGELGDGFYLTFGYAASGAVSSVKVERYGFRQGISEDGAYFVNFLLGEDGEIARVATIAILSDGGYLFMAVSVTQEGGGYLLACENGNTYRVTVQRDASGAPLTDESGEYYRITVNIL